MTAELKLPERDVLCRHIIDSLCAYWSQNTDLLSKIPVHCHQEKVKIVLPLKMVAIDLPVWGKQFGVKGQMLVPQECVSSERDSWEQVDWWLAMFLLMEGWHERLWEQKKGTIHSYSSRLKGWDSRAWDHAWVNRICLFLRSWYTEIHNTSIDFFGNLPVTNIAISHDIDAVCKTHSIRLKQSAFQFFNAFSLLLKFRIKRSFRKLANGIKFLLSNEDWWVFDKLLKVEKAAGVSAVYHFYSDQRPKTFKRWLMDPSYEIKSERLEILLSELKDAGHKVGLHPTYDAWNDTELLEEQKKTLEESLDSPVTYCRQHWLRFSWKDTWLHQARSGLTQDSTLMFNDRSGFRNSCAMSWKPWNPQAHKEHQIGCISSVIMDSHLFDYNDFSCCERNEYMRNWIIECKEVHGTCSLLWHPHTLTKDYGWNEDFNMMLETISDKEL